MVSLIFTKNLINENKYPLNQAIPLGAFAYVKITYIEMNIVVVVGIC